MSLCVKSVRQLCELTCRAGCHVLAHESFEDEVTAKLMNERYVNIKVCLSRNHDMYHGTHTGEGIDDE